MLDYYVPLSAGEVRLLVEMAYFFTLDTDKAVVPIKVRKGEVFFDFNDGFNGIGMPDFFVPLRPGTEPQMEILVESYWQHVKGAELEPGFLQRFAACVDTSRYSPEATIRLMDKMERAVKLLKRAGGS
jgi:hypothetical protein